MALEAPGDPRTLRSGRRRTGKVAGGHDPPGSAAPLVPIGVRPVQAADPDRPPSVPGIGCGRWSSTSVVTEGLGDSSYDPDLGRRGGRHRPATRHRAVRRRGARPRSHDPPRRRDPRPQRLRLGRARAAGGDGRRDQGTGGGRVRVRVPTPSRTAPRSRWGDATLLGVATPGHTPEHLAYVLRDGAEPIALFSGGSLHGRRCRPHRPARPRTHRRAHAAAVPFDATARRAGRRRPGAPHPQGPAASAPSDRPASGGPRRSSRGARRQPGVHRDRRGGVRATAADRPDGVPRALRGDGADQPGRTAGARFAASLLGR